MANYVNGAQAPQQINNAQVAQQQVYGQANQQQVPQNQQYQQQVPQNQQYQQQVPQNQQYQQQAPQEQEHRSSYGDVGGHVLGNVGKGGAQMITGRRNVVRFSVAAGTYKGTVWKNLVVYDDNQRLQSFAAKLQQGSRVYIEYDEYPNDYTNKDGVVVHGADLVATKIMFAGGSRNGQQQNSQQAGGYQNQQQNGVQQAPPAPVNEFVDLPQGLNAPFPGTQTQAPQEQSDQLPFMDAPNNPFIQ